MTTEQVKLNPEIEPWTFTVSLSLSAHSQAEKFRRYHSNSDKAKQVYLNTLAVYAVDIYLQCLGFETNLENSDSWNPAMQSLMDVADLVVKDRGKLECRPVLPNAEIVSIPSEISYQRIGYIAVKLNESLREATVLGFVEKVTNTKLALNQLQSLQKLPIQLNKISPLVKLSKWFDNVFELGWQAVETILSNQELEPDFSFRSTPKVSRCKEIELESLGQSLVLLVEITAESEEEINICVEVHPSKDENYLPSNIELSILDENEESVMNICGQSENKTIQLEFVAETDDRFAVKIALENTIVLENFVT